jgi:RNA polymerase sigma-70 factor (sigma-E family)
VSVEQAGFEEFVAWRSSHLLRTAFLLTGDAGKAEDLLQTALVRAWRAWGRIDGDPEPYVRRILVTTATSAWRRRWRGEQPQENLPERTSSGAPDRRTGDPSGAVEDRRDLWAALRRLPPRQRAVVVLRFFEDLTEAQTGEVLGCSIGTVKSQAARALARLRVDSALDGYGAGSRPEVNVANEEGTR